MKITFNKHLFRNLFDLLIEVYNDTIEIDIG